MTETGLTRRTWVYVLSPVTFEMRCDLCGGSNITWSEWEHMIWCYDCQRDTPGTGGVLNGPVAIELMEMLGLSLDRIDLATGQRSKPVTRDRHVVYEPIEGNTHDY